MATVLWRRGGESLRRIPALSTGLQCKPFSNSSFLRTNKLTKSYVHNPSKLKFPGKTVGQTLEDTVAKYPNKEIFVFFSERIRKTYEEFHYDVRQAAAGFLSLGINRGDRLAIWGTNSYDWVVTQFAVFQIGAILVNLNPAYRSAELSYSMNKVGVKAIVCPPSFKTSDYYGMLTENCPELENSQPGQLKSKGCLQKEKLTKSYVHQPSSLKFLGRTIGQALEDITAKHPNKEAFVFCSEGISKTYQEVLHDVQKAAAGFLSIGINRGDRLGIWGPNSYDWVVTQLAAAQIGAILVNINPGYRSTELNYCLNKVGVKAIVSSPAFKTSDYYAMLKENCPELDDCQPGQLKSAQIPSLETVIMMGDDNFKGTYKFKEITENGKDEHFQAMKKLHENLGFDDAINIQFTSGTTGFPKGCTLSHQTLLNNAYSIGLKMKYNQEGSRLCLPIPLYHAFATTGGPMTTIVHPVPSIFPSATFEPEPTLEAIEKERVTSMYATPTIFVLLLSDPNFNKYNYDTLQSGLMGGSPCPAELMKQVIKRMGVDHLMIGYGLTETGPAMTITPMEVPAEERVTFVGNTIDHQELKVVDPVTRTILPVNTPGEVCGRGYNIMLEYWEDEQKTKEAIDAAGWFSTGDIGTIDEDGRLRITGRIKDIIIRGGENIFPAEIENFLLSHPKVENAQVVGVPHEQWGEEVCACIKVKEGETATKDEIIEFCKGKIAHFKVPSYVVFMDSFPLTVTFKVKKFELRDIVVKRLAEEQT